MVRMRGSARLLWGVLWLVTSALGGNMFEGYLAVWGGKKKKGVFWISTSYGDLWLMSLLALPGCVVGVGFRCDRIARGIFGFVFWPFLSAMELRTSRGRRA